MKKIYNTLLLCASLSAFPLLANDNSTEEKAPQDLQEKIEQAITYYEQTARDQWSYQISNYENEEGDITSSIEKFDPSQQTDEQWTLLSINGEAPTEKQQQKFIKAKLKQAKEKAARKEKEASEKESNPENQSFRLQFRELIQLESLKFVSETDGKIIADFDVYLKRLGEDASRQLQGLLTYNEQGKFIEHIKITNKDSFSPVFSAKITDFKITFDFAKLESAILPQEYQLSMKGTFAFFTEIEEVSTNTFSEYRFVGE